MEKYDLIVIGSGIGGLSVGSIYSRLKKKKVLIIEKHFKIGGFTHIFKRENKFHWDVGIHYVGDMEEGNMMREIFDIVTAKGVQWNKMPYIFEKFVYPDLVFEVPSEEKKYKQSLVELFPEERLGIDRYFQDVKSTASWFSKYFAMKTMPSTLEKVGTFLNLLGAKHALITTKEYLDKNFNNKKLKAILTSQWGDYGLPPSKSSFLIHSLIVTHYFGGGYYPSGGSGKIAESIKPIIQENGGNLLINHEVTEIIVSNKQATGVKVVETKGGNKIEKEFFAPLIVSDAGVYTTYKKLIPESVSIPFREEIENLYTGISNVTLYLGLKENPNKLGVLGENYWIYNSYDHDENYENRNGLIDGNPSGVYLSFPSLKDNTGKAPTAEIISFVDYQPFEKWKTQEWKKRDSDYQALKEKITESLLGAVERHLPGFKDFVEYKELSTPVTNEFFTGYKNGTIYGIPCTPERFKKDWIGAKTPLQNLYLTGADASSPGIAGALMGGINASMHILGFSGMISLLKELRKIKMDRIPI